MPIRFRRRQRPGQVAHAPAEPGRVQSSAGPRSGQLLDVASTLEEGARLAAAGRLVDAVDLLVDAHRAHGDHQLALALQALRLQAASSWVPGPGRIDWPPFYADPFPTVQGRVPVVDQDGLTTEFLGGAVAHHGALVVRGAFTPEQVARSVGSVDRARASFNAHADGDGKDGDAWFQPLHVAPQMKNQILRNMVLGHGGIWLADSPAATEQVLGDLGAAGILPAIAGHFDERPFFSLQKSTLRRSAPEFRFTAWHQDGSFLTPGVRTMNAWVALSRCGGDYPAPGLEILPQRMGEILPVDGVMSPHSISYDLMAELAAETPTVLTEFEPGDALLFDERLAHRTHLTADMTEPRYAIECWFFAPSHHSTGYVPLLA